jgi:hypothetical protein
MKPLSVCILHTAPSEFCVQCLICLLNIVFVFRGDKRDFGLRLTSGCIPTNGSSSALLHTVLDILGYCIVFQRWQKGFWGEDNIWSHTSWQQQLYLLH